MKEKVFNRYDVNEYNIDPWQMDWLKRELKKSLSYKYFFVFMYVPLLTCPPCSITG